MIVNGYKIIGELNNANSGFSKWGFAEKGGKEYFIKELITPVYPLDTTALSPEMLKSRIDFCHEFENKYRGLYMAINDASRGNLVRVIDFFRSGSRYYIVTEKVENRSLSREVISKFSNEKKYLLLKSMAYCFMCLHKAGVVHMDVKPNNFMIKQTESGNCVARLIDFDAGFLLGSAREKDEELGGDLTYLAPEVFLDMIGEDVEITQKADIFSLGLVFHEFFCGKLPDYDPDEYDYPYEAALDKGALEPDMHLLTPEISMLIAGMLDSDPDKRPDSSQIMSDLIRITNDAKTPDVGEYKAEITLSERFIYKKTTTPTYKIEKTEEKKVVKKPEKVDAWFSSAGDL